MITKDNNLKVMKVFYKQPNSEHHIRELSRTVKLSSTGIIKIVKRLKKEKLLLTRKRANLELITPDLDGNFYLMKRLYNIYSLYESGLIDHLKKHYEMPEAIVLFGSYSQGMDTEKSDIDIAIISKISKKMPELKNYERNLDRPINIHQINLASTTKEFKNSLSNGVILEGFIEIIK